MSDFDLVFDFGGWKLNGVYIFSEPAAFAFLGLEDTPPTKTVIQPGLLERMKAGLTGRKAKEKRIVRDDESLRYRKYGLWLEYEENQIYGFTIDILEINLNASSFPIQFVFGNDTLDLNATSSFQQVKDIFGNPDEEDDELRYLIYNIKDYNLHFDFGEDQNLESIEGFIVNADENEDDKNMG